MPNSAFLSASDPKDLRAWESDILCLALGSEGLRGSDHRSPPSMCVSEMTYTVVCHVGQLTPPSLFVLFVWIVLAQHCPEGTVGHSRCHWCQTLPTRRLRGHSLTRISPSPFPQVPASLEALI